MTFGPVTHVRREFLPVAGTPLTPLSGVPANPADRSGVECQKKRGLVRSPNHATLGIAHGENESDCEDNYVPSLAS